jgi:hypothetical protein
MSGHTEARALPCDCCEGSGWEPEWEESQDETGHWEDRYVQSDRPCSYCDGTGLMVIEVEPIEMEDLPEGSTS